MVASGFVPGGSSAFSEIVVDDSEVPSSISASGASRCPVYTDPAFAEGGWLDVTFGTDCVVLGSLGASPSTAQDSGVTRGADGAVSAFADGCSVTVTSGADR